MHIRNGDLVWRRTEDSRFANHYGIAVHLPDGLHVMHRQRHNGGVIEPLDVFLLGHRLRGSRPTKLTGRTPLELELRFAGTRAGDFNILTNNCEHWAYRYLEDRPTLTDTDMRVLLGIALVCAFAIWKA